MINNDGYTDVEIKSQGKNCQGLDIFVSKSKWKKQSDEKATNLPPPPKKKNFSGYNVCLFCCFFVFHVKIKTFKNTNIP